MERYKQALEIFLRIDKTSPNGDHEVCYYIGMAKNWERPNEKENATRLIPIGIWIFPNVFFSLSGDLLYRKCNRMQVTVTDEVKEYFHRAVRDGKQLESYNILAEIYKTENNLPKAIEMLENITQ